MLFLVRELRPVGYGIYALATSIAGLLVLPAGLGLPMAIGRYVADHRHDRAQIRALLRIGLRLQLPIVLLTAGGLLLSAGAIAHAYHQPHLGWPLRWAALAVIGQTTYNFLISVPTSVRRSGFGLGMALTESAVETFSAIALVLAGAGAAGATLGKALGYVVGAGLGTYLIRKLVGRSSRVRASAPVAVRALLGYAGATFVVDLGFTVIATTDSILIAAILDPSALGNFSAVMRLMVVLGYLGTAVAGGVAPTALDGCGSSEPDRGALRDGVRLLILAQGLAIAPMVVWASPIVTLLLGRRYHTAAEILRVLTPYSFAMAPAGLLSLSITYLGAAHRRVAVMGVTLSIGIVATYVLLRAVGVIGAAIADDIVAIIYVGANLRLCAQLVALELRPLALTLARVLVAAVAMGAVLWAFGRAELSAAHWLAGSALGLLAYAAVILLTGEVTVAEVGALAERIGMGAPIRRLGGGRRGTRRP